MNERDPLSEETIFSAALRRPPDERTRFLDEACVGLPGLRQRVDELLKAQLRLGEFMEAPATIGTSESMVSILPPDEKPGCRIGRYKLLQKIGEGGCGVVYMAEQEEPVKRRVALKVIKLGMDTKSVIARFEAERQALAMMDHPSIAKVLDAGATETGRPYFVMELVKGTKITEFCDQNRLSTRERLDLFIQVCQAVQHAHQKGIIHRDLKPSNILVTINDPGAAGMPKVIDFGIAKATQGRLTDQTLFTALEQFLGTPAYMSPEQAMMTALDIDTRSDVYSLGVLLYELLTGRTPFDAKELLALGFEEMRRTIREKEPLRPSTRLSTLLAADQTSAARFRQAEPPKLVHLVRGDLDWIVMKCLEKDRARRYETANALAMDLQRHLSNEPVLARPPSRLYEFQKTFRRHKAGFTATAVVLLALAAGVIFTTREAGRARRAELQTRRTAYIADMDLANRAINEDDLGAARTLLRRYIPEPGETDLRNWEWRYLASLADGDPHFSLVSHTSSVLSLGFLDDKTLLTAGSADWRTILWNVEERQPSMVITNGGFGGGISPVIALAPARYSMFYRGGWRGATRVCVVDLLNGIDRMGGPEEDLFLDVKKPIKSLAISPDQKVLAVAFGQQVGLWDLDRKVWSKKFTTEPANAIQGLFSPNGGMLAVTDDSGRVALWDLAKDLRLGVLLRANKAEEPGPLGFSRDGRWLVSPGGSSPTLVWNVADQAVIAELHDGVFADRAVFSPDGRWLAMVGGNAGVRLWETTRWEVTRTLRGHTDPILSLDFSPNGRILATGARNGEVKLWSMDESPTQRGRISFPAADYFSVAGDGSAFGRILASGESNGVPVVTAEAWTTDPLQRVFSVTVPNGPPRSGVVLQDGRGVVLGGMDGTISLLGPVVGKEMVASNAHKTDVYLMDVSMDGTTLATKGMRNSAQPEGQIRIWRLPQLEQIAELKQAATVHGIKLSDDGKRLAGFTGPGDMGVWEIPSMKGPPMWRGVAALQRVTVSEFSPDSRWLAAAPPDGSAFLWNLATRRRMTLPRALTAYTSLSFSPDGSRLAAGSEGESKLFDTASGQVVLSFKSPGMKLAFDRDGERLLAVNEMEASVLRAPALERLKFDWLNERPSEEPPPYLGPDPDYARPDRPATNTSR